MAGMKGKTGRGGGGWGVEAGKAEGGHYVHC